jgi:hypothetical protein
MMGAFFGMGYFCTDDILLSFVRIFSEVRVSHLGRKYKNYNRAAFFSVKSLGRIRFLNGSHYQFPRILVSMLK